MEPGLASKIFEILKKDRVNLYCADCNSPNANFGVIEYGIFICHKCVALHREMNRECAIKVLVGEIWDEEEIKFMITGGNGAMRDYFMFYRCTIEMPIHLKYGTPAAAFYKDMLATIARGGFFEGTFLSFEEGVFPSQNARASLPAQQPSEDLSLASISKETSREQFFSPQPEKGIRSWFRRKFNEVREVGNNAFKSINNFGNSEVMRDIEFISVGLANNVKGTFISTAQEDIQWIFLEKYNQKIASCPAHTMLSINLNSGSRTIKQEAMDTLVNPQDRENQI